MMTEHNEIPIKNPVFCLMGPTASGKTALVLQLSDLLPIDIISVDSAMIYRGMDIGTAKPSANILAKYPHALVDICDPKEIYSVGHFYQDALLKIKESIAAKRIPFLVGGTMMYFRALERGLAELPKGNANIRAQIVTEAEEKGWDFLHQSLMMIDEKAAMRIHPNDKQRIQRALEVYYVSQKSMTQYQEETIKQQDFSYVWMGIFPEDRILLHHTIKERFKEMLQDGLIDEVKRLYDREDLSLMLPSMRSVNYRQVWEYLEGNVSFEEMFEKAIAATRQLAKRQITWLRSFSNLQVLSENDKLKQLLRIISMAE